MALSNDKVKSKLKAIIEASNSQSQSSSEKQSSSVQSEQMSRRSNKNSSSIENGLNQQQQEEEEKKESTSIQKGPTAQPNCKLIDRINLKGVGQKMQVENRGSGKPVTPIPEENKIPNQKRPDASAGLQSQKQSTQKKGPWQPAVGIDHVSERSDFDENERLSEIQQTKGQIEAAKFLEKSGRIIMSPSKPLEKRPAIEALKLNGFLSNHRGSGKQTKKIQKSDSGLSVIQFPEINRKKK